MDNKLVSPYANQLQSMPSGAKYSNLGSRNIALIIDHWSYATLTWTWLKHNFLRRHHGVDGRATLDNEDRLFIVRKSRKEEEEGVWKRGGPLIQDFDTAMERYPHIVVQLEGSFKSSLGRFVRNSSIDVVVVCDEFRSRGLLNTWQSVGDFVRQNISSPFVIIRPEAVRGTAGFRLVQTISKEDRHRDLSPIRPTSAPTVRKIAIAYPNNFTIGRALINAARKLLLQPTDEIYLVHTFPKQGHSVVSQTKKIVRTMTLQKQLEREVTEDNSIEFGAAELEGFPNIHLNVTLRGDPKVALPAFCEQECIQLLVIGTHTEGLLRKTFSGGSVSGTLIEKAPCVCFSIPYKYMGLTNVDDGMGPSGSGGGEMVASPSSLTSPTLVGGRSGSGALSPGESAVIDVMDAVMSLQRQVEEKDQMIAALQEELERLKMKQ
jgi:nucleotide-binding universal stress UspA family protein